MEQSASSTRNAPAAVARRNARPRPRDVLELLKPITWFPPMWAFMCGAVSSGSGLDGRWWFVAGGVMLAGPLVCGTSQAVNDWFDRHVDAINEPDRPIPSGRIGGRWGLYIALIMTAISASVGWLLGPLVFVAGLIGGGLGFLWYNAPPAAVFMGDTGSLALGGALGAIAVATKHEIVLAIVGGLFVVEALSVIIQVAYFKRTGKRVFLMAPIHHHYEKKGWSEPQIVIRFWIIALILAMIGLATLKVR